MDPKEALRQAFLRGHFWGFDEGQLTLDEVLALDVNHKLARQAWDSWRAADANYDTLLMAAHPQRRFAAYHDDTFGPATEALVSLPRCPLPDSVPPEGVDFTGLHAWEQKLLQSYREFATGSGGWPVGCDPERTDVHSIRVNVNTSRRPATITEYFDKAVEAAIACAAEIGIAGRIILDGDAQKAEIEVKWENIPGGVIGYQYFPQPNTCRQTTSGRLDTAYQPSSWKMFATLFVHEHFGHGIGFQHTRGGIMNPSILSVPLSYVNDPAYSQAQRMYGGQPIPVDPTEPEDPTTPPTERPIVDGTLSIGGYEYIVIPKPAV